MPGKGLGGRTHRGSALHARNLAQIHERGIETAEVTLHVGLGTFQPVREERVEDHETAPRIIFHFSGAAAAINRALDSGRRVVAVGTTTVRTLEYSARESRRIQAGSGEADIFIYPGHEFGWWARYSPIFISCSPPLLMLACAFAELQAARARRLPPCRGPALPVLFVRRLHVSGVTVSGIY